MILFSCYIIIHVIAIRIDFIATNENILNLKYILNNCEKRILLINNQP